MADHGFATTFATAASDQLLQLEHDHGHGDRFDAIDALTANLLAAALSGNKLVDIQPGVRGTKNTDILTIGPLTSGERALVDQTFTLATQQARGAWFLPEQATLKAATLNLPSYLRHHPWHAITLAFDDVARVQLASTSDAVAAWALLLPLSDTLLAPVLKRAEGSTDPADKQHETWSAILDSYQRLGIHAGPAIAMFTYRGGWSHLDRAGQAQARAAVLDALAGCDLRQIAARFRTMRVQALTAATVTKASRGTPLARQLLTKKLQPVLAAYFGGEWLAFLSYLGMPPNPNEEVVSALPEPRLYVSGSTKAAAVAAEHGLDVDDVHAMLAAFMGQASSTSPVERRVDVLNRWWAEFDALHARQTTGMPSLWGPVEAGTLDVSRGFGRASPLYRQMMTPDLVADIDQLWDGVVLPRWPDVGGG